MKIILTSATFFFASLAFSQVSFTEQNTTSGNNTQPGSNIATMTSQERRVWIMGDKAKILARSTKESSKTAADLGTSTAQSAANNANDSYLAAADKEIQMKELTLNLAKGEKSPDKKKIAEMEQQLEAAKQNRKAMEKKLKENESASQEKTNTQISQIDKDALAKDMQKESGNADVIRMDKGLVWKINTAEMTYQEKKIESQVSGTGNTGTMLAGLYAVASQDMGDGGMIAGYKTKKYKITVTMNAGGTPSPYFTTEIWVAEDLESAKQQVNKLNNDYKQKTAVSALPPLNVNAVIFEMIPEVNDKINSIKGMVLKKSYKGDGAMASMFYATEIVKLSTEPIDEKTFELPAEVKKQK